MAMVSWASWLIEPKDIAATDEAPDDAVLGLDLGRGARACPR